MESGALEEKGKRGFRWKGKKKKEERGLYRKMEDKERGL